MSAHDEHHEHYILEDKMAYKVFGLLILGTIITVITAAMDFGAFDFALAMLIASTKAYFVCAYFMGLKFDEAANKVYFLGSFLFVFIFILLTASDIFFRDHDYKDKKFRKPIPSEVSSSDNSH
ncbi:MAG: cytochrome C oxidase subunit IV family protein [Oligoflexales bacterium]|nr:cytochrome C oxidase subunit IV family protein [Oligoflexales bacterium]